jgi:O-antigen/teichoic acid export membrane protein
VYRQIIYYLPANIVPAACSFLLIYAYTRLLTPDAFGVYSLVFSAVLVAQTALFYAVPITITRFRPGAALADKETSFLRVAYTVFYATSAGVILLCAVISFLPWITLPPEALGTMWLSLPLLLSRSAVGMNQAVNRSADRMGRFNLIECTHAVLGLVAGIALIWVLGPTAHAVLLGMLSAGVLCAVVDLRLLLLPLRHTGQPLDRAALSHLLGYAWPLVTVAITASLLQLSDRFLLGGLGDAHMLGLYAVAYSLVERPMSLICSSVSTATFPIAISVLERQGREAGRIQAGKNGAVLLALTLPACVGLWLTAPYIAAALVGPAFRDGVATLIPIMCVTALLNGVRAHFIDHAFHLASRSMLMLWTYGPAAVANVALNLLLIPRYGMMGAAWTGLICQGIAVIVGWIVGRRIFPLWVPLGEIARIAGAVSAMAVVLKMVSFPLDWSGLLASVALGGGTFLIFAVLLNVGGVRSRLSLPSGRRRLPVP